MEKTKKDIRNLTRSVRDALTKDEMVHKSSRIENHLMNVPEFVNARSVMMYVSKESEVCTHTILQWLVCNKKHVIVPYCKKGDNKIIAAHIKEYDDLEIGAYGIMQPREDIIHVVNPETIEVCIVPGIAFDVKGHRIGYGKGCYDIFLHENASKKTKIGLCYQCQVVNEIKTDVHDVAVNVLVTENGITRIES
ncbi:MAG: 5-formyltetrahydrofolate cyclo-ligase [Candidatus Ancaeobacter aquaticus]|nr:5-formyltetrahydrofolate cyclo-ligase [Candidatus Ancaeobacter aquaticus]